MKNFNIYENMQDLDIDKLVEIAKSEEWPRGKRYTVNCNGKEFKIQTYFNKASEPYCAYDAYSSIASIYARQLEEKEIGWEHEEPQYAMPEFDKNKIKRLPNEEFIRRMRFIKAVSNLINNQETMEAIVATAAKKKDGFLHKNRVVKLASTGISDGISAVYALVARAKSDSSLSIVFDEQLCRVPEDNEKWANDFISTVHEGLPITDALNAINVKKQ